LSREVAALPADPVFAVSHGQPLSSGLQKSNCQVSSVLLRQGRQIIGAGSTLIGNARPR
jgi:hypothetical protein